MADSIVSSTASDVVSDVVSQLAKLLIREAAFLRGVKDQVEWVKTELTGMQGFLKDAESRRRGDERVENWIREVRDVAYEAEDIIDRVNYMAERRRQRRGFIGSISRYSQKPCELITLHKIGSEIKKIEKKIRGISERRDRYGIANLGESGVEEAGGWDDHLQALREIPDHFFHDTDVIGFDDDKKKLVKLLVDPENKNRRVISIVGMGGLGKTTLARKLYNMAEVKPHFHTHVWLTISQKYDVRAILKDIVKNSIPSVAKEELEEMRERELKEKIYNFFQDRRYFVVMDDVWDVPAWDRIDQAFPDKNNGSRVLLTTRNIEVARSIDPSTDPYELHFLKDAESWELLRRKAFPNQDMIPEELQGVGWNLAKKCGGLPLALVVLGGFMASKERSYPAWSEVDKNIGWEFMQQGKRCLDILALSYNGLPHQLKSCFLYVAAAFPEDYIISASKLVRLWTAEGLIPQRPKQTLEEAARDCLAVLVQRCMIQAVGKNEAYGQVKSIRVHDMLREVGISEARKEGFLQVCSSDDDMVISAGITTSHRVAFHDRINEEVAVSSPRLRTLLGFNLEALTSAGRFLNGLNLLRVLDLEGARDLELPKQMGKYMIHLRYLGLRNTCLERLPSSIGCLLNLQTLDARETGILWLPKSFWKIRTLRHVYINVHMFLSAPIIGDHKNLQTLKITWVYTDEDVMGMIRSLGKSRFIKNWVTTYSSCSNTEKAYERIFSESFGKSLEKMENSLLSFTLGMPRARLSADIFFAHARHLKKLRSLYLHDGRFQRQQLPDSCQFPPNLTKLIIWECYLKVDPMPVLEKLPNLRHLQLVYAYYGKSMSCSAGGFPRLQHLLLSQPPDYLEEWRVEVGAMPCLTHLTIDSCKKLKMLPEGLQHVTTLRELKLIGMLVAFNDRIRNEDGYMVRHIPSIIFEDELREPEDASRAIAARDHRDADMDAP